MKRVSIVSEEELKLLAKEELHNTEHGAKRDIGNYRESDDHQLENAHEGRRESHTSLYDGGSAFTHSAAHERMIIGKNVLAIDESAKSSEAYPDTVSASVGRA